MNSPDDKTVIVSAPAGQDGARAHETPDVAVVRDTAAQEPARETEDDAAGKAAGEAKGETDGGNAEASGEGPGDTAAPHTGQPAESAGPATREDEATRIVPPAPATPAAPAAAAAAAPVQTQTPAAASDLAADPGAHQALPVGTTISEFEIAGLIGEGGFGIVYLAWDTLLRRRVALKEYIPASLATRAVGTSQVTVRSQRNEETFRAGLRSFINEAQLLAQFDHHSLVKVYRFWEANGTAYMVMPYYEGETLKDALRQMPEPPGEAWLRALLAPLLEALAVLHGAQCFHRDIAPDNIMLLKGSQRPLLLDFGAARRVIGDMTQALTVILKPGYAPVEQYAEVPSMKQGPWTDIYALAAVVYYAIEGKTPPAAVGRLLSDTCAPLATVAAGRYSESFLRAIDHALAVRPEDRPQDVQALAAELGIAIGDGTATPPADGATTGAAPAAVRAAAGGFATGTTSARAATPGTSGTPRSTTGATGTASTPAATTRAGGKRGSMIAAVAAGVAILGAIGAWFALRPTGAPPASAQHASATVAAAPPAASPAATAELPPVPPASATTAATTAATTTATATTPGANTATPAEPPLPPFTPSGEFGRIVALSDPSIRVTTKLRSTKARIKKDFLAFQVTSDRAGYVYAFMVDPQGNYLMLLPNQRDKANTIAAGQTLSLPRPSWPMLADAPAGPIHFIVLVSPQARDFSAAGLQQGDVFADFPAEAQAAAAAHRTASYSPFAGTARCAPGAPKCSDAFGAAAFQIDVVGASGQ
ncbi:serine/threonine-protein kinase [Paraburkholderia sp.]|uniref:serine/threonine-protein kinase n=1 Tax=Paraburkholderia sp. TaxID=1926495 RepID=UPI0025D0C123|nr:serine/threonine-protein kinase [Paraburkholderia sp.]